MSTATQAYSKKGSGALDTVPEQLPVYAIGTPLFQDDIGPAPLPIYVFGPHSFIEGVDEHVLTASAARHLGAYGSHFFIEVDAPTGFASICEILKDMESKAFVQRVPGGMRWHIQACWLKKPPHDDTEKAYTVRLLGIYLPAMPGDEQPRWLYESEAENESRTIRLLSVNVAHISDCRCLVKLIGVTQGGLALMRRVMNEIAFLYPMSKHGKPGANPTPWLDTEEKLKNLLEIRANAIRTNTPIPKWGAACACAAIDTKTAKKHKPEWRKHWEDREIGEL